MIQELRGPGRLRIAAALLWSLAIGPGLVAQNSLRGWGAVRFDTDAFALPVNWLAMVSTSSVVLRADGRIFVQGSTILPNGPPAPAGTSCTQVAMCAEYSAMPSGFGLLSNGTIVSWGTTGPGLPAPALPLNTTYVQLSAGYDHALALRSDGVAVAWGANSAGQTALPAVPAGTLVQRVHAGNGFSLLLLTNGTIVGCGANNYGQLAVPPLPTGVTYTDLWGGVFHAIARRSDGTLASWGENSAGQCNVPPPPAGVTYTILGLGSEHTIGVRSDGVVVGWGWNDYGQCNVPALPPGAQIAQVVAGQTHSMVRLTNGAVIGWGQGGFAGPFPALPPGERWSASASGHPVLGLTSSGQVVTLGNGSSAVPALPPGMTYTNVIAGQGHGVALRSDGRAVAWGDNTHGQCAIPPLPPGMTYTSGSAGFGRTLLLRSDGMAMEAATFPVAIPVPPPGLRYEEVCCHSHGTILRRSDGQVLVLGGQSGNQANVPPLPSGLRYVSVAIARTFCAALRSDGEVILWGSGPAAPLPPLPAGAVYVQIEAGDDQVAARRSDGTIAGVALASYDPFPNVPVPAAGESFVEVSAGWYWGVVRVGTTSTYVSFANGCAGTRPASRLVPRDTPRLGAFHEVTVFDLPQDAAVMVFGWNRTAPVPLTSYGMPGCSQHITVDAAVLLLGQNNQAKYRLGIPGSVGLVGLHFHNQAVVLDPAANAAGAVVSNAAEGVIGSW